jgi:hypothetical protein
MKRGLLAHGLADSALLSTTGKTVKGQRTDEGSKQITQGNYPTRNECEGANRRPHKQNYTPNYVAKPMKQTRTNAYNKNMGKVSKPRTMTAMRPVFLLLESESSSSSSSFFLRSSLSLPSLPLALFVFLLLLLVLLFDLDEDADAESPLCLSVD